MEDFGDGPPFDLRTVCNFRARVRRYGEGTGEDLWARVFEQVTDEQLRRFGIAVGRQRMDSTEVLSNLARGSRLELLIRALQWGLKGLEGEARQR